MDSEKKLLLSLEKFIKIDQILRTGYCKTYSSGLGFFLHQKAKATI